MGFLSLRINPTRNDPAHETKDPNRVQGHKIVVSLFEDFDESFFVFPAPCLIRIEVDCLQLKPERNGKPRDCEAA